MWHSLYALRNLYKNGDGSKGPPFLYNAMIKLSVDSACTMLLYILIRARAHGCYILRQIVLLARIKFWLFFSIHQVPS